MVKHTVYLTLLDELLQREPWRSEIRLRECHAGRGIYLPFSDGSWFTWCLVEYASESVLGRAEVGALDELGFFDPGMCPPLKPIQHPASTHLGQHRTDSGE